MSSKRYTEEFKIEAVKQVTERGYSVAEVAERLGTTTHSLYNWLKRYGQKGSQQTNRIDDQAEIARLKAELRRVSEEQDILKKAAVDSIGHCNKYSKISICRGSSNEANIHTGRTR